MLPAIFAAAILVNPFAEDVSQRGVLVAQADAGSVANDAPFAADAGTAINIFAECEQYKPPPGDFAVTVDGGYILLSPARASYDACRIAATAKYEQLTDVPPLPSGDSILSLSHSIGAAIVAIITAEVTVIGSRAQQGCRAVANPFAACH